MADELVLYHREGAIAHVQLNRPEKLNALNDAVRGQLRECLERFDDDEEALVAIISGSGRAFCTGADVSAVMVEEGNNVATRSVGAELSGRSHRLHRIMLEMMNWKPVIAAVHGYAIGGGIVLALACDVIVAASGSKFQVTEISRGISGNEIWSYIRQRTGDEFANEVTLTGRMFSAEEARRAGMISRVSEEGAHFMAALEIAQQIAAKPPLAVREAVRLRRLEYEMLEVEARKVVPRHLRFSQDYIESARAFVEKREPRFVGR